MREREREEREREKWVDLSLYFGGLCSCSCEWDSSIGGHFRHSFTQHFGPEIASDLHRVRTTPTQIVSALVQHHHRCCCLVLLCCRSSRSRRRRIQDSLDLCTDGRSRRRGGGEGNVGHGFEKRMDRVAQRMPQVRMLQNGGHQFRQVFHAMLGLDDFLLCIKHE